MCVGYGCPRFVLEWWCRVQRAGPCVSFVVEMVLAGAVVGCQGTRNREGEASVDGWLLGELPVILF